MSEMEFSTPNVDTQTVVVPELAAAQVEARQVTQQEIGLLDREICLGNFVDELNILCTPEEKYKLIALMIKAEESLPKTFDQLPAKIALIKIQKILPNVRVADKQAQENRITKPLRKKKRGSSKIRKRTLC